MKLTISHHNFDVFVLASSFSESVAMTPYSLLMDETVDKYCGSLESTPSELLSAEDCDALTSSRGFGGGPSPSMQARI